MSEEQYVDTEGLTAWIAEHTDLPLSIVGAVLKLEMDYMEAVGITHGPDESSPQYQQGDSKEDAPEIDLSRLAQDAERDLGIPAETALAVYEAESNFLEMRGLLTREE